MAINNGKLAQLVHYNIRIYYNDDDDRRKKTSQVVYTRIYYNSCSRIQTE